MAVLDRPGWAAASSPIDMAIEFREIDFEYGESCQLNLATNCTILFELQNVTPQCLSLAGLGPEKISVQHNVHGEFTWEDFGPRLGFVVRVHNATVQRGDELLERFLRVITHPSVSFCQGPTSFFVDDPRGLASICEVPEGQSLGLDPI